MISSTLWVVALRFSLKGIGLISTVILARLLNPTDFGIMGFLAISMGLFIAFTNFGVDMLLIRNQQALREDYDTAWTFKVIQHLLIAAIMLLLATPIANYFKEPILLQVIPVYVIAIALGGFENIGIVNFRKNLEFSKDFKFNLYARVISFFIVISLAFYLRNYWAFVIGAIGTAIGGLVLSYVMHAYRPKLCLKQSKEFLSFSFYLSLTNIARYLNDSFPRIVVGRLTDTENFGRFHVAQELPSVLVGEPVIAASRALLPNYARVRDDQALFHESFLNSLSMIMLLGFPASFGLAAISADVVALVFGPKWANLEEIMKWMSIFAFLSYFIQFITSNMVVVEHGERWTLVMGWVRFAILAMFVLTSGFMFGYTAIPPAMVLACFVIFPVVIFTASKCFNIEVFRFYKIFWRPFIASILMYLMIDSIHIEDEFLLPFRLLTNIMIGMLSYTFFVGLFWLASGCEDGLELAAKKKVSAFIYRN